MILESVRITDYRSIDDSTAFTVDPDVTAFVGLNESGKTCILQSIDKALSEDEEYQIESDYPRKKLAVYNRAKDKPAVLASTLTFKLNEDEFRKIAEEFGLGILRERTFTVKFHYPPSKQVWDIPIAEAAAITKIVQEGALIPGFGALVESEATVRDVLLKLHTATLDEQGIALRAALNTKFSFDKKSTDDFLWRTVMKWLKERMPKAFYFDDYYTLPAKVNLQDLQTRRNNKNLEEPHKTILALFEVSGVTIEELMAADGFESARARLEAISANISDRIFEFWKQNDSIGVEFHISDDPKDSAPYNNGKNLYVRIKNSRHRVSMPLSNRSKGFIWFFSFLIWFDKVSSEEGQSPILLLDEPGLNLHALAQKDLLSYVENLAKTHQVLYTTHSPFMVDSSHLERVRVVEDKPKEGTQVSANVSGSNKTTLFPLQAALGYTIAQNLFIQTRNLLIEGPADLLLLKFMSSFLEQASRTGLRTDVALTPCGGASKVATFVSLLNANDLEIVTLLDFSGSADPHLTDLIRQKLLSQKQVLHYGEFRPNSNTQPTDVEDLVAVSAYLDAFNRTYAAISSAAIAESDLPPGSRILARIESVLSQRKVNVRPSGGFNHYAVMQTLVTNPFTPDAQTLATFDSIFRKVNGLYSA